MSLAKQLSLLDVKRKRVISPSDFDLVALAGRGFFGKVWVVRQKNDYSGKVMAMKVLNKQKALEGDSIAHSLLEREILAQLRGHPFIVDLYMAFQSESNMFLLMEYLPGGHLLSYVHDIGKPWEEPMCQFYGAEILLALEFMHKRNVIYRDLKLENILLDMDGHIRLSDFGLSACVKGDNDRVKSLSGTPSYLAPEIIIDRDIGHGKSVDIWAFGIVMFILLLHESPFYSENTKELLDMILHQELIWDWYKESISPEALDLLQNLLIKDPTHRIGCGPRGIQEIKDHPFFNGVCWDDIIQLKARPFLRPKLRIAERASQQDKNDLLSNQITVEHAEFEGFSFVASDSVFPQSDTADNITNLSFTDEEEDMFNWPFPNGQSLPISVVQHILSYLSIEDISRASNVCNVWYDILWQSLRKIDFSSLTGSQVSKYWESHIAKVLRRPNRLLTLRLPLTITNHGIGSIPKLRYLEQLSFRGCDRITSDGFGHFDTVPHKNRAALSKNQKAKFPHIRKLDLSDCSNITDTALVYLKRFSNLNQIFLNNTSITDSGLAHLLALKGLWRVTLQGLTELTDQGILQLVELPNLRVVDLSGCTNLTSKGVELLRTRAQQLEVLVWVAQSHTGEKSSSKKKSLLRITRKFSEKKKQDTTNKPLKSSARSFKPFSLSKRSAEKKEQQALKTSSKTIKFECGEDESDQKSPLEEHLPLEPLEDQPNEKHTSITSPRKRKSKKGSKVDHEKKIKPKKSKTKTKSKPQEQPIVVTQDVIVPLRAEAFTKAKQEKRNKRKSKLQEDLQKLDLLMQTKTNKKTKANVTTTAPIRRSISSNVLTKQRVQQTTNPIKTKDDSVLNCTSSSSIELSPRRPENEPEKEPEKESEKESLPRFESEPDTRSSVPVIQRARATSSHSIPLTLEVDLIDNESIVVNRKQFFETLTTQTLHAARISSTPNAIHISTKHSTRTPKVPVSPKAVNNVELTLDEQTMKAIDEKKESSEETTPRNNPTVEMGSPRDVSIPLGLLQSRKAFFESQSLANRSPRSRRF